MLDGLNFKEFVAFLSAFSPRTSLQQKIEFIFRVYDTDCNGKVAFDDILSILRDLTGSFMTEQQRQVCALDFWCLLVYHTLQKSLDHYSKIINNLDVIPLAA